MRADSFRRCGIAIGLVVGLTCGAGAVLTAQTNVTATFSVERTGEAVTATFFNRPIVTLRARIMGRGPSERAAAAERVLEELAAERLVGPVTSQPIGDGVMISVGSHPVVAVIAADVDELSGETVEGVSRQTIARVQQALAEATEARKPQRILGAIVASTAIVLLASLLVWGINGAYRRIARRLVAIAEQKVTESGIAPIGALRASRVLDVERGFVTAAATVADLVVVYATVGFVLRRFPYTRPWGESMRAFLLNTTGTLGLGFMHALPGLFTVLLVFVLARFLIRLLTIWFAAVERGEVRARWIYPETAQPTRRLVATLVWLFAIVVAYPYMPGSGSEAFKGVTVFLGLMITFGSSGAVNQIMSGFMVTYSRALRVGDFVRIGETEGTVTHLGMLSVKLKTPRNEEVTIPHAVVVSQTTTDYTRFGNTEGVFTPTSVTIGYDTPWRQVESLLLLAAGRTTGLRDAPKPMVLQTGLQDFYVQYTLFVCLERQETKPFILHALHANIQDLFNEYGVQIMSPNYVLDPTKPKVVPKKDWFAPPAGPPSGEPAGETEPIESQYSLKRR